MKEQTKHYLKLGVILLAMSLTFNNCQKDDSFKEPIEEAKTESDIQVKKVSLDEVKQNHILKKSLDKIQNQLDVNRTKGSDVASRIDATDGSFTILTDDIVQVTANGKVTYAFGIEIPTNPDSSFENFVIEQLEDDSILFYIYRYREIDNDTIEDEDAFTVSRELIDSDNINIGDFEDYMGRVYYDPESDCYFTASTINGVLVITITSCGSDTGSNNDGTNTGGSSGVTYGEWEYFDTNGDGICLRSRPVLMNGQPLIIDGHPVVDTEYGIPCSEGEPVDTDNDSGTSGSENTDPNYDPLHDNDPVGNQEGGGGNPPNYDDGHSSETSTVGVVKSPSNADIVVNDFFDNLDSDLKAFLLNNRSLKDQIATYLKSHVKRTMGENGMEWAIEEEAKAEMIDFIKIKEELPDAKLDRYLELLDLIEENPWALIQDCAQQNGLDTQNYLDLYNLPFPQECSDRLFYMGVEWHHQPITDGNVPLANIDYYGVEITNYPDFNNDGNSDSEAEIYQAFRERFTDLASGDVDDFQFSCDILFNTTDTGDISWEFVPLTNQDGIDFISNDPISSILLIEADASGILPWIATDDGAVMVSDFTNNDWTISTIMTPNNGTQPFSGNRQWGWLINQNGNFEFFTRAVDVANISVLLNIAANTECQQETYYDIAEATWKNMQQEIVDWINSPESNGGQASISTTKAIRVEKEKIEELLTRHEAIDQINCD